jgi:hypothetical protein
MSTANPILDALLQVIHPYVDMVMPDMQWTERETFGQINTFLDYDSDLDEDDKTKCLISILCSDLGK